MTDNEQILIRITHLSLLLRLANGEAEIYDLYSTNSINEVTFSFNLPKFHLIMNKLFFFKFSFFSQKIYKTIYAKISLLNGVICYDCDIN